MLLKNKNAVIYGAGGSLGSAVAKAFAREGATVFLAGRTISTLEAVRQSILNNGGSAEAAVVDAMDEKAVAEFLDAVLRKAGSIDISFNAIAVNAVQNIPLYEMSLKDFMLPITISMQSQWVTATAAARQMLKQESGVILSLTATPGGMAYPQTGGFGVACNAIEAFSRNLAAELGPKGIRAVCMRSAGSPDSAVFSEYVRKEPTAAAVRLGEMAGDGMLKRLPLMNEIASVAVFLCSDMASAMTGTTANITCGTTRD
jgi:3-oxoacyl-[acyl-carrier protein] reductase